MPELVRLTQARTHSYGRGGRGRMPSRGWIVGLVVGLTSVILAALLWSSGQL
jgi:hypothetical protein